MIKAGKMVHVRVTHKHITDSQQHPGGEAPDLADVEQQRTAREFQINEHSGVPPDPIHELRVENGPHRAKNAAASTLMPALPATVPARAQNASSPSVPCGRWAAAPVPS